MGNIDPTELRSLLDGRPRGEDYRKAAEYLLNVSPECECERAEPVAGGHGQVKSDEILTLFIGAPRHSRKRSVDPKILKKRNGFPYNAAIFDAACEGGLSLLREKYATNEEVEHQVEKIASGLRKEDPSGGIFSVFQFPAKTVFGSKDSQENARYFCVYDTPITSEGCEIDVFSHADLFLGGPKGSHPKSLRTQRRVQIVDAIKSAFTELKLADYREHILKPWEASPSLTIEASSLDKA